MKLFAYFFIFYVACAHSASNGLVSDNCAQIIQSGNFHKALAVCNQALNHVGNESINALPIYLQLATIHHQLGNNEDESYYLAKVKSHSKFIEDIETQYEWHRRVGQKYYAAANYQLSQQHLNQALTIAENENKPIWLSKSHNDVGLVELKQENFKIALLHYQKSLTLKKQHGNKYQIAKTLNNLGLVHFELELFQEAVTYYESALSHYLSYSEQSQFDERVFYDIAHIYEDLSRAYSANNESSKANKYAQAILKSLKLKIAPLEQARALLNLANWHHKNNSHNISSTFLEEATTLLDAQNNDELYAQSLLLRSQIQMASGQKTQAETTVETGLALAKTLNNDQLITDFYLVMGQIFQQNNPKKALKAFKQYQKYREQFLKKKYDSDLRSVQHEIETQQIEQQLLNQKLANVEQKNQLQQMTNYVLWIVIVLGLLVALLFIYHIKRKKEKESLVKTIHYHKQQLLLLEATQNQPPTVANLEDPSQLKTQLKSQLVTAMIDAINTWEKSTQLNQIELAEQSKIWTVSIDNGTLRTRSLDKYLSIEKIPQNPRWRNVVKTCHFILSQDQLDAKDRQLLNQHTEDIMETVRCLSLSQQ